MRVAGFTAMPARSSAVPHKRPLQRSHVSSQAPSPRRWSSGDRPRPAGSVPMASTSSSEPYSTQQVAVSEEAEGGKERKVTGGLDFILSQANGVEEDLFKGTVLGVSADIAAGDFMYDSEVRTLSEVDSDHHIPPRFFDAFATHLAKNFLADDINGRVPLILGIWGGKGCGKSFNVELCCKRLGVAPIIVSAGELEDERAGEPAKRLRQRYIRASQVIETENQMACLIINDLDAGVGRFKNTPGHTVNNQMVQAALMNLCDRPHDVSSGEVADDGAPLRRREVRRVPIIVTANDLSALYAPLVRDGRMDKFYWHPQRDDLVAMLAPLFEREGLSAADCGVLVDAFPGQPLDFFGAIKASLVDGAVRRWIAHSGGVPALGDALLNARGPGGGRERPTLPLEGVTLEAAVAAGRRLAREQQHVVDIQLARDYMRWQEEPAAAAPAAEREAAGPRGFTPQLSKQGAQMVESLMAAEAAAPTYEEVDREREAEEEEAARAREMEAARSAQERGWAAAEASAAFHLVAAQGHVYVDIRSRKEHEREAPKGSVNVPAVVIRGFGVEAETVVLDSFVDDWAAAFPDRGTRLVVGSLTGEDYCEECMSKLAAAGYGNLVALQGGYDAWNEIFTPRGVRRQKGKWGTPGSDEHDMWTASN